MRYAETSKPKIRAHRLVIRRRVMPSPTSSVQTRAPWTESHTRPDRTCRTLSFYVISWRPPNHFLLDEILVPSDDLHGLPAPPVRPPPTATSSGLTVVLAEYLLRTANRGVPPCLSQIVLLNVARLSPRRSIYDKPNGYLRFAALATRPGEKCGQSEVHSKKPIGRLDE